MSAYKGSVKWYNDKKGFGFILPDHGGPDVFVHATALKDGQKIAEGQPVSYDLGKDRDGRPVAVNIA